jgi:Ca2+-binding RTX toxin-like protein
MLAGASNGTGNALDNTLYAGDGNNVLNGVSGVDTASYQFATAAVSVSLATTAVQVTGGSGSDTLQNIDNLVGSNFHDTLVGDAQANTLNGLALNDYLDGGAGNDVLLGGDGTDLLIGGLGQDLLTGGTGSDTFDFNALDETGLTNTTWDVISDFGHGTDKLDLATLDADTALAPATRRSPIRCSGGRSPASLPVPAICTSTPWRMSSTVIPTPTPRRNSRFSSSGSPP